jgi:hypothetical protein
MYRNMFSINDINNGTLKAINAMPQKDITSDGTSTFEMGRKVYNQQQHFINATKTQTHSNWTSATNTNSITRSANDVVSTKKGKWFGNRDSSQVVANRRNTAIGKGSINTTKTPLSFTTDKVVNTTSDALRRVRAGGAVAPAKKNANRNNGLAPSFAPAVPANNIYGIKNPVLYH